ncbi:hypothetical protein F2Q68_00018433 [Brassica cretica]|uniref:Peptidase A1 domain-containing protein n=1 Tax=Brassica cretica TaxID=69181 RepID=A0A8S9HF75_BRACR|nr:hypothetical protein F2Q68_00018433 [Brassica cretica]
MDLTRRHWSLSTIFLSAALATLLISPRLSAAATENLAFKVRSKFAGKIEKDLGALKAHDAHRHSRLLSAIDLPLGGDSQPESTGLYFAKIGLGTPSRDYHVQVDTGSDILWVNCAGCISCPRKSDLVDLTPYDSDASSTAKSVSCDDSFCSYVNQISECHSGSTCKYIIQYGDQSSTSGHLVRDVVHLDLVTGNRQTGSTNGTIIFGCGSKQSGQLGESVSAVDGIMGFGQSNSSKIQAASLAPFKYIRPGTLCNGSSLLESKEEFLEPSLFLEFFLFFTPKPGEQGEPGVGLLLSADRQDPILRALIILTRHSRPTVVQSHPRWSSSEKD